MGSLPAWLWLVLIAFVAWMMLSRRAGKSKPNSSTSERSQPPFPTHADFVWPTLDTFDFEVVGESHYQPVLAALMGDVSDPTIDGKGMAVLLPYDDKPHDDKAVRVTIAGFTVGHLSRDDARKYRRRLKAKAGGMAAAMCGCQIVGGHQLRDGTQASFGVMLDMKPFE